ncbi:3-hydroxyacyl-ACP dehydratase FabZ [Ferrimonas lipolytica]|uniref:3-hydroxyacyl-[acyl-carrier-protein] dehydratase FabZ n=1 Tax=Ferrimonas lipolytica TaxID=2724191 RepID=A0A6H1UEB4_9GAMM|nr:3-hydroxyacyl-ACP dehydratase FabZ [Ferrimonas lipolytica]QIZ77384.1 3-hydroxyacyl-ACP dehydratase FabZ [Ferrimonas lipolytica]
MSESMNSMEINEILEYLPHRHPFMLVDRVLDYTPGERLVARKNVSYNEPFFPGHFPQQPIMPGVLILEALAQASAILAFKTNGKQDNCLYLFAGIDNARFKRQVVPGDTLELEVVFQKERRGIGFFSARASVDGELAASCDLMCAKRETK